MWKLLPAPGSHLPSWCCQCLLGTESSSPWFWLHFTQARPWRLVLAVPRTSDASGRSSGSAKPCRPQCPSPDHPHDFLRDPVVLQHLPEHLQIQSTKNRCSPVFHSKVYSTIILCEAVCPQQYFPSRNSSCLFRLLAQYLVCRQDNPSSSLK